MNKKCLKILIISIIIYSIILIILCYFYTKDLCSKTREYKYLKTNFKNNSYKKLESYEFMNMIIKIAFSIISFLFPMFFLLAKFKKCKFFKTISLFLMIIIIFIEFIEIILSINIYLLKKNKIIPYVTMIFYNYNNNDNNFKSSIEKCKIYDCFFIKSSSVSHKGT